MIPAIRASIAILIFAAASVVMIPLPWIAVRFDGDLQISLPQYWHRLAVSLIGVNIIVHGAPDPRKPLLMAANHTSWLDLPVIGSLAPLSFVADSKIVGRPILGLLAKLQSSVFVDRNDTAYAGETAYQIATRAAPGDTVVVFAEGTSNAGNGVLPFCGGLVETAREVLANNDRGVWVQPLSIAYTSVQGLPMGRQFRRVAAWTGEVRFLPHAWTVLRENSIDAVISFGEPIRYEPGADRARITRQAEDSVRKMTANVLTGRDPF